MGILSIKKSVVEFLIIIKFLVWLSRRINPKFNLFLRKNKDTLDYMRDTFGVDPLIKREVEENLREFLVQQAAWCNDASFSVRFPYRELGLPQAFFLQKLTEHKGATYLTGPRYVNGDITRPFIELVASSRPLGKNAASEIFDVWRPLGAQSIRVLHRAGNPTPGIIDQSIYARAVPKDFAQLTHKLNCKLIIGTGADLEWCLNAMNVAYDATYKKFPGLSTEASCSDEEDILDALTGGNLFIILQSGHRAGFIICENKRRDFFTGNWILDEVVLPDFRGQGLAAAAQIELLKNFYLLDQKHALLGTIVSGNFPSRRAAASAGRVSVLDYVFMSPETFRE